MDEKNSALREATMDVARTLVKSGGGYLIAHGLATSSDVAVLAGAAAVLVGLVWSWISTSGAFG